MAACRGEARAGGGAEGSQKNSSDQSLRGEKGAFRPEANSSTYGESGNRQTGARGAHGPPSGASLDECLDALSGSIREVACELTGAKPTSRLNHHWRFGGKGSLAVIVSGAKRGSWFDHEAGVGGDALGLVAHLRRCSMREAYAWAGAWLGLERRAAAIRPVAEEKPEPQPSETAQMARRLWREAEKAVGSPVAVYLASRGLALPPDAPLRFHPSCPRGAERWPAMLALMTDPLTGQPCGVHRTFLARDCGGKAPGQAKMMSGKAGIIRLVPDAEVTFGLGIAEGIETSLALMQAFGWWPIWATASAGAMARLPILPGIEALTIYADADDSGAGWNAAMVCADRWSAAGREAVVHAAPAGEDFLDTARRVA